MEPAGRIDVQPWMTAPATRAVLDALMVAGATVRFVGGCVRDAVLGRPVSDLDIATPDPPETVMELLGAAGIRVVPTGIKHGTVTAVVAPAHFEITTLRRDVETYGRHAKVAFTDDWKADAARRDFTINAMSCAPDGTLYDSFGGLDDLHAGRVRFVGDAAQRIDEDVLRLLRFFRFYAYYGRPPPDAEAIAACRAAAPELPKLSGERVSAELLRLLAANSATDVLGLMIETGVLGAIVPEIAAVGALSELCAIEGGDADPLRRLALLLRRGRGGAAAVAERLKLSNARRKRLVAMAEPTVAVTADLDVKEQRRALYRVGAVVFVDLVDLGWAEALFRAPEDREALAEAYAPMHETAGAWEAPQLPVKGADVVALGVPDGPEVGRLLGAVEAWWEAGDYRAGRKAALAKLGELVVARAG